MAVADNVVLIALAPARFVRTRQEDMRQACFALVELCALPIPQDWPQFGIKLTAGCPSNSTATRLKMFSTPV